MDSTSAFAMVLNSGVVVLLCVVFWDAEVVRGLLLVGLLP
jgi:hypothetical protein